MSKFTRSNLKNTFTAALTAAGIGTATFVAPVMLAAGVDGAVHPAQAACLAGAKIDKSTAAEAKAKIQKAGFSQIKDLKKGCDNYWHGVAKKDGNETHVVLSPKGTVMTEGD
jgi:hypothetical protein